MSRWLQLVILTLILVLLLHSSLPSRAQEAPVPPAPLSPQQQHASGRLVALLTATVPNSAVRKTFTLQAVQQAISNGADINAKDQYGITALIVASCDGNGSLVQWLLAHGACKKDLDTAFFIASERGSTNVIRLLLDYGADVNAKDDRGDTYTADLRRAWTVAGIGRHHGRPASAGPGSACQCKGRQGKHSPDDCL